MKSDQSSIYPNSFVYRFPGKRCDGTAADIVPDYYIKKVLLSDVGITSQGSPAPKVFYETALALFNVGNPSPTNQSTLDLLATKHAQDYVNWLGFQFDRSFPKVVAADFVGLYDELTVDYNVTGVTSRLRSVFRNDEPEQLMHHDYANISCTATYTPCPTAVTDITCASGQLTVRLSKICIIDGRLTQEYVKTISL